MTSGLNNPNPLMPHIDWRDIQSVRADLLAHQRQINDLARMVNALAQRVLVLESRLTDGGPPP